MVVKIEQLNGYFKSRDANDNILNIRPVGRYSIDVNASGVIGIWDITTAVPYRLHNELFSDYKDGAGVQLGGNVDATINALTSILAPAAAAASMQNLPFGADAFQLSNADVNGNYQTVEYFSGGLLGTLVKTVNLTYDAQNNVVSYVEV